MTIHYDTLQYITLYICCQIESGTTPHPQFTYNAIHEFKPRFNVFPGNCMKRIICCNTCNVTKDGKHFSPIRTSDRGLMYFQTCDNLIPTSKLLKAARQQRWRLKQQLTKANINDLSVSTTPTLITLQGTPSETLA